MAVNIADIIAELRRGQQQANEQNRIRYQQGLQTLRGTRGTMRNLYGQAEQLTADLGQSALRDVNRGAERTQALGRQDLISSGLGSTTMVGSMLRGTEEDRRRAAERVEEDVARQRASLATGQAGAEMGMGGAISDFIAARSDIGPDMGLYSSLIQAAAGQQQPRTTVSAGLGPMARAGLTGTGRESRYFGGSGGAGGGGSSFGGGGLGSSGGGGGGGAGPARFYGPGFGTNTGPSPTPDFGPANLFLGEKGVASGTGWDPSAGPPQSRQQDESQDLASIGRTGSAEEARRAYEQYKKQHKKKAMPPVSFGSFTGYRKFA